jgi:hypothetical protein
MLFLLHSRSLHQLIVVSTLILEKKLLGNEVSGECDGRDAEAGERAFEAVEAGEGACVSPLLTTSVSLSRQVMRFAGMSYYRAHGSPLVPFAEEAANFLGSKPVMEGRGAMVMEL